MSNLAGFGFVCNICVFVEGEVKIHQITGNSEMFYFFKLKKGELMTYSLEFTSKQMWTNLCLVGVQLEPPEDLRNIDQQVYSKVISSYYVLKSQALKSRSLDSSNNDKDFTQALESALTSASAGFMMRCQGQVTKRSGMKYWEDMFS